MSFIHTFIKVHVLFSDQYTSLSFICNLSRFHQVNIAYLLWQQHLRMLLDSCFCHLMLMLRSKVHCWMLNFLRSKAFKALLLLYTTILWSWLVVWLWQLSFWSVIKALVNVLGTIACKEKCGPSVSVTLLRLAGKRTEERKTVSLTDSSSEFLFSDVIPGKYRLEV